MYSRVQGRALTREFLSTRVLFTLINDFVNSAEEICKKPRCPSLQIVIIQTVAVRIEWIKVFQGGVVYLEGERV